MSAIFRHEGTDVLNNVFIFYDFKQVHDAVLVVVFARELSRWEKVFIYNSANGWETSVLKEYMTQSRFDSICKKLDFIFHQREHPNDMHGKDMEKAILDHGDFLDGIAS